MYRLPAVPQLARTWNVVCCSYVCFLISVLVMKLRINVTIVKEKRKNPFVPYFGISNSETNLTTPWNSKSVIPFRWYKRSNGHIH